jgi:4-amino-4-deoxy-L-arabinose transferase-like glycosyltransferase
MKHKTILLVLAISFLSLFLNVYNQRIIPPCFNADEAAFSYNAYSIGQTGKDEYGTTLPIRLKSFGDFKMPLYTYLSVPFINVFGLNEYTAEYVNHVLSFLLPVVVFLLVKELFSSSPVALLSSLFISTSLGLHLVSRHTHEAFLGAFLVMLTTYLMVWVMKKPSVMLYMGLAVSEILMLFGYQSNRVFIPFFLIAPFIVILPKTLIKKKLLLIPVLIIGIFLIFSIGDIIYKPERVKNLLFINNGGYTATINELRGEGGSRLLYNKLVYGIRTVALEHSKYFSPQFLAIDGDTNYRFGYPGMGPMTLFEYIGIGLGLYFLFRKKEQWRFFILGLLLVTPLSASLSWAHDSLTRSLFILIPLLILSAYGYYHMYSLTSRRYKALLLVALVAVESFFLGYNWDFYLNHYPKRPLVMKAWQCGYKEMGEYIQQNYNNVDKFYITRKNGEPYIMVLFYMKFDPATYQKQAALSAPDEYGFGQVERFDKFEFNFRLPQDEQNYVAVGYPDDFQGTNIKESEVKKIKAGNDDVFWVYEKK